MLCSADCLELWMPPWLFLNGTTSSKDPSNPKALVQTPSEFAQ